MVLKGISPLISPSLLKILAEMGHGDEIVLADAHFPSHSICGPGVEVIRADGKSIALFYSKFQAFQAVSRSSYWMARIRVLTRICKNRNFSISFDRSNYPLIRGGHVWRDARDDDGDCERRHSRSDCRDFIQRSTCIWLFGMACPSHCVHR